MNALFIVIGDVGDTYQLRSGRKSAIFLGSSKVVGTLSTMASDVGDTCQLRGDYVALFYFEQFLAILLNYPLLGWRTNNLACCIYVSYRALIEHLC